MRLFAIVGRIRELGHNVVLQVAGLATERIPPTRVPFQKLGYVQNPMTYLMLCDLVILPVKDRTLGMHSKLVEAMAAGKPVLATREACCGLLPLVGRSGIIICDTISEMVAAACKCFDDPELMDSMGMKNRDLAAQLFSIAAIGAQLESTYARTLQLQRSLPQNKNGGNSGRD
jgi:glycosyltransferase involved in cell wall biosynthesis